MKSVPRHRETSVPVALLDLDGTVYDGLSYFDVLAHHTDEGLVAPSAMQHAREVLAAYKDGRLFYEDALSKLLTHYAAGLQSVPYDAVQQSTYNFFRTNPNKLRAFVPPVVGRLALTHQSLLVTGEPQFIAQAASEAMGLDDSVSSTFDVQDGVFTGEVARPLAYDHQKVSALHDKLHYVVRRGSFAFGDSEGDIAVLAAVENPICINPTPRLAAYAHANGWHVATPDTVPGVVDRLAP